MAISLPSKASAIGWRTPAVIVLCGCLISMISFGPRATLGFFLTPMSQANDWGRDVFGLALAIQNILWGIGQPFAGAIADRYGTMRVLCAGGAFYAIGLILMAYSTSPAMLDLAAGVFVGFGLAGCSFSVVLAAFGKLLPERWRLLAFGAGTAAGSFGQFLYSPLAVSLMDAFGWQTALLSFGMGMLLVLPLSLALATAPAESSQGAPSQSLRQALSEAIGHRAVQHRRLARLGLARQSHAQRYILSFIYFARAAAVLAFISFPVTPLSSILFGAVMGLLWLSTVAPTNGIIALIFGTRWLATLAGLAFFSHQVGGFLGVWLGGIVFVRTGSYDAVWWLSVLFGVLSAVINLPIVEKPVM